MPLTTCNLVLEVGPCGIPPVLICLSMLSLCHSCSGNHTAVISWVQFTWYIHKTLSTSRCPGPLGIFLYTSHCVFLSNFAFNLTICLSISQSLFQVFAFVAPLLHICQWNIQNNSFFLIPILLHAAVGIH